MFQKTCFFLLLTLCVLSAHSQCTESLGIPVFTETFGAGKLIYAAPLPPGVTAFKYLTSECPDDGQYAIVNYTSGCYNNAWHTLTDHTGDPNGYFMIANASADPTNFFVQNVDGLCPGTTYQFSAWIVNMEQVGGLILPNITFTVEKTDGTILGSYDTGPIPVTNPATWAQYGISFKTPVGISTVVLRMHNNAPGGGGNDVGLDDISFAPSGPKTVVGITGFKGDTAENTCTKSISLFSTIGNCYISNAYQWQISTDGATWADIPGAASPTYAVNPTTAGVYRYRLTVAENGNIGSISCRAISNTVTINYTPYPLPAVNNISASICPGGAYLLPSGLSVTNPGVYTDTLYNKQGCDSLINTFTISMGARPDLGPDKTLCIGDSTLLNPGVFSSYLWQDKSTSPTYKVVTGGTYWVKVTDDNGCQTADTVVIKNAYCSALKVPNTFTPNNDGVNDTWNIKGLSYFKQCTVYIYDRWGQQVFSSIGYPKPWDGTYNGKRLPFGTYYYVINLNIGVQPLAGFVMIVR